MTELLLSLALSFNIEYLARCIEGEMGPMTDPELGLWIGHTMVNRVDSQWFPNSLAEAVTQGCHGYTNVQYPSKWSYDLALRVLSERDVTGGCYFFLSDHDIMNHNFSVEGVVKEFSERGHSVYFFQNWPKENKGETLGTSR